MSNLYEWYYLGSHYRVYVLANTVDTAIRRMKIFNREFLGIPDISANIVWDERNEAGWIDD